MTYPAVYGPLYGVTTTGTDTWLQLPRAVTWTGSNGAMPVSLASWVPDRRGPPNPSPWAVPFGGYVLAWPQQWDTGTIRGKTEATVTDAFGYMTANLQPILIQEILNDGPQSYWTLTDSPPINYASNVAKGNANPLYVIQSKYGTGGLTGQFGQNGDALLGAQGTLQLTSSVRTQSEAGMWGITGTNDTGTVPLGVSLGTTDVTFPPLSGTITIEMWYQLTSTAAADDGNLLSMYSSTTPQLAWVIESFSNRGTLVLQNGDNPLIPWAPAGDYIGGSIVNQAVMVATNNMYILYFNGVKVNSGMFTTPVHDFVTLTVNGISGWVRGYLGDYNSNLNFNGYVGHLAIFAGALSPERIQAHYQAGQNGCTGDTASGRIERLLQATPYLGRRCILQDQGTEVTATSSCQDIGGQAASISLNNISVNTIPGQLWVKSCGDMFYQAKTYAWNNPVTWVLGNRPELGEIPAEPGLAFSSDPQRVLNSVQLTQLDNLDIVIPQGSIMTAIEAASTAQYGTLSYWETGYLEGDLTEPLSFGPGLFDLANWIAATSATPVLRVTSVSVEAAARPLAWAFFMQASAGDMMTLNWRPPTDTGAEISVTGRISQIERHLRFSVSSGMTGMITCLVDVAPEENVLTVGDPARGQLSGVNCLGW
jgi:hypothetical protein